MELAATIAAIQAAAEGAKQDYEIIVVDDASTDATADIARQNGAQVISINRRHIAAARNTGGRGARGNVLCFVDADTRLNTLHGVDAIDALKNGYAGGSPRLAVDNDIARW